MSRGFLRAAPLLWTTAGFAFVAVLVFALLPREHVPELDLGHGDKLLHAIVWLGLGIVLWPAVRLAVRRGRWWRALVVWAVTVAFGAIVEGLQGLVPYRSADALDLAADAVGATLACVLMVMVELAFDRRARKIASSRGRDAHAASSRQTLEAP